MGDNNSKPVEECTCPPDRKKQRTEEESAKHVCVKGESADKAADRYAQLYPLHDLAMSNKVQLLKDTLKKYKPIGGGPKSQPSSPNPQSIAPAEPEGRRATRRSSRAQSPGSRKRKAADEEGGGATAAAAAAAAAATATAPAPEAAVQDPVEAAKAAGDIDCRDEDNRTPLMVAALNGSSTCAQLLLKHGAHPNLTDDCGESAAHLAAFSGKLDALAFCVHYGADVNLKNHEGRTPYDEAVAENQHDCAVFLSCYSSNGKSCAWIPKSARGGAVAKAAAASSQAAEAVRIDKENDIEPDAAAADATVASCLEKVKRQQGVKCRNQGEPGALPIRILSATVSPDPIPPGARALWTVECEAAEDIPDGTIDMHIQRPLPYHMRAEPLSKAVESLPVKKGPFRLQLHVDAPVPGWLMPQGEYESETKLLGGPGNKTVLAHCRFTFWVKKVL